MAEQTIEKVAIVDHEGKVIESGTLSLYADRLEFDGKRRKITFPNIRGVTVEPSLSQPTISLTHGTGGNLSVTRFMKTTVGMPKKRNDVNRQFFETLRGVYGETQLTGADKQRMASADEIVRQTKLRGARRSIWIGVPLMIVGIVVTIVTYANASGGGSYFIAYGPVIVGLGMFADGMVKARKYRDRPPNSHGANAMRS